MRHPLDHNMNAIRLSGWIGIICAIFLLLLLVVTFITGQNQRVSHNLPTTISDTAPLIVVDIPTLAQNTTNTSVIPPSSSSRLVADDVNPDTWFPLSSDISDKLISGNTNKLTNKTVAWGNSDNLKKFEKWGRGNTYERFYTHPDDCNSNNLKSVYIEIIFFQSSEGPKNFFDWASTDTVVDFINSVGNNAYVYRRNNIIEGNCQVDIDSITFTRYNVATRVKISVISGTMNDNQVDVILKKATSIIDKKLFDAAK